MITGLGFTEILLVAGLVLMFFGSKELPYLIRNGARLIARLRRYSDKVRREINDVTRSLDISEQSGNEKIPAQKNALREKHLGLCRELKEDDRAGRSQKIVDALVASDTFANAKSVMVYLSMPYEVDTSGIVAHLVEQKKRVVVPYCKPHSHELGIAAIDNLDKDIEKGAYGVLEPVAGVRDNFFKSDLQLIIVPGVAFDRYGARLGKGKGYYDNFLRELRGHVPIWGLAFGCQISDKTLPFAYHDVSVDQVVTEDGLMMQTSS